MVNVGKYTSPMDSVGIGFHGIDVIHVKLPQWPSEFASTFIKVWPNPIHPNTFWGGIWTPKHLLRRLRGFQTPSHQVFGGFWMFRERIWANYNTVDGRNPAPVDMENIPLFTGFYTFQVVPGFLPQTVVHQPGFSWNKGICPYRTTIWGFLVVGGRKKSDQKYDIN